MADDCRLTTAEHFEVELVGATIEVTVEGIQLEAFETARFVLLSEGPETRCQLLACRDAIGRAPQATSLWPSIALASRPRRVVIVHSVGEAVFEFEHVVVPVTEAEPVRGDPTRWDRQAEAEDAAAPDWVHGPIASQPPPAPVDAGRGEYAGGGGGGAYPADAGASLPPAHERGRVEEFDAQPGGIFRRWKGQLRDRWVPRSAPQALPDEGQPHEPQPARALPSEDRGPTAALEAEDAGPTAAMEADDRGPAAATEAPEPQPTAAMANADGQDEPTPTIGMFPRLDAPKFFEVGTPTDIVVGIRPDEDVAVGGGSLTLPPTAAPKFFLSVQVIADGFDLAGNTTSWVHDLAVTLQQPFPFVELTIVAMPIDVPAEAAIINVIYTVDDQVIGKGKRAVAVGTQPGAAEKVELPDVAVKRAMALPVGATPADLTVVILADDTGAGDRLLWAFRTPYDVDVPKSDCATEIGNRPEAFADALRRNAERAEGKPTLLKTMRGIGRSITRAIHEEFWRVFDEVRKKTDGKPTVLFLSEEPYVPWELAILPASIDPDNDKFLGAEAVTGRWLLIDGPQMPPPEQVTMKSMAVVFGEYANSKFKDLKEAKVEMESLKSTFQATPVRATQAALNELLDGKPSAEVLHFAIHGKFADEGADLLMEDGSALGPFTIEGANLTSAPLVFLNACQVGAGNELLGAFAGMSQAFLSAGASAVIAPLWSVRDDIAREISQRFYPAAFAGEPPAEVLRRERASFSASDPPVSSTFLAYQFYGHPAFRLTK